MDGNSSWLSLPERETVLELLLDVFQASLLEDARRIPSSLLERLLDILDMMGGGISCS
jgi:hypothetical protein